VISDLAREGDRDRYWCAQFAPPALRPAMLAVLAFAVELTAVPSKTTREPMMSALRFAWWREGLDAIFSEGRVPQTPTLEALASAVRSHELPREILDQMIDAAEMSASGGAEDLQGLVALATTEGAGPLTLWLRILEAESRATQTAVTAAGTAWALSRRAFARTDRDAVLAAALVEVERGRSQRNDVLDTALPALLPMALAVRSLRALCRGRDPARDNRALRQLELLGNALLSRY